MRDLRALLLIGLFVLVAGSIFLSVRARVRRSPRTRTSVMIFSGLAVILSGVVGLWLPPRVPDTGSPATIVAIILLWFVGGALLLVGLPSLLGAALASLPRQVLK